MKDFDLRKYLAEGKLLKEDQMMGKYIQTQHPDGYDMIMSFSMLLTTRLIWRLNQRRLEVSLYPLSELRQFRPDLAHITVTVT